MATPAVPGYGLATGAGGGVPIPHNGAGLRRLSVLLKKPLAGIGHVRTIADRSDAIRHHDTVCGASASDTCGHVQTRRTGVAGYVLATNGVR